MRSLPYVARSGLRVRTGDLPNDLAGGVFFGQELMPVRRETGAGVRSWCRWTGSNYSWPATTGERPVVGPAATGRRADADGAESAESRRPSNLLRLAPAKEVEHTLDPSLP